MSIFVTSPITDLQCNLQQELSDVLKNIIVRCQSVYRKEGFGKALGSRKDQ